MDTAPQDICQGSCDPVDCMPTEKRILSTFLSASERIGLPWTDKEDTQMLFSLLFFSFFFKRRGKIFIFKLRFFFVHSLNQYALCYRVTFFFFFFFLFTQYPKKMLTAPNNALNVPHREDQKKLNRCSFLQSVSKRGTIGQMFTVEFRQFLGCICQTCDPAVTFSNSRPM